MDKPFVSVISGSKNDAEFLEPAFSLFNDFGVRYEYQVLSAHRHTERLFDYINDADSRGVSVYLTAAGFSAALPGVVAAKTLKPVLGPSACWAPARRGCSVVYSSAS